LYQLLLAANSFDFASRHHVEDIINVITISMLVFSKLRILVDIAVADQAIALESSCIRHDDQVVQIHEEAEKIEEGLGEYFVWVVSLGSV